MEKTNTEKKISNLVKKFRKAKFVHNGRALDEGIDCLGFIILFYKEFGIDIPSDDGKPIEKDWYKKDPERYIRSIKKMPYSSVSLDELRPLDMVYFAINRNIITHTGIMISNKRFIHMSPRSGFLISRLERHWRRKCKGALRLIENLDL